MFLFDEVFLCLCLGFGISLPVLGARWMRRPSACRECWMINLGRGTKPRARDVEEAGETQRLCNFACLLFVDVFLLC
jgi:hypothetical protein